MKFETIDSTTHFSASCMFEAAETGNFYIMHVVPKDVCNSGLQLLLSGILFPGVSDKDSFAAWH